MKKSRFTASQILAVLKQAEAGSKMSYVIDEFNKYTDVNIGGGVKAASAAAQHQIIYGPVIK